MVQEFRVDKARFDSCKADIFLVVVCHGCQCGGVMYFIAFGGAVCRSLSQGAYSGNGGNRDKMPAAPLAEMVVGM